VSADYPAHRRQGARWRAPASGPTTVTQGLKMLSGKLSFLAATRFAIKATAVSTAPSLWTTAFGG